ncbi:MAG TPA: protein-disulfide reductase DsbD domain-containing protein [Pyrinomonadaceae bacterium]|nr:protein-disulfide reductase DsbD domain-containing protein [Pyrinomonadaceae bacterium]
MNRKTFIALSLCAPLLLSACAGGESQQANATASPAPATSPSGATARAASTPTQEPQVVSASAVETKLAAGGAGEAAVKLDIAEGYHVHANPASDKFYIATELQAAPQEGFTPGKPVYPKALTRKLEFANAPLALYEGQPVIKLPLRADKSVAKGRHTFRVTVRVQACNDQACLPPRNIETLIPLTID